MKDVYTDEEVLRYMMSGFVVLLMDGLAKGVAFGMQGYNFRSISEPSNEVNERGSREGFTEPALVDLCGQYIRAFCGADIGEQGPGLTFQKGLKIAGGQDHALLFNIAAAEETTPFPLMIEALIIHFLYEIMRE